MSGGSTLVNYHDCIKSGDHVKIRATVVERNNGSKILSLTAHGPRCKSYPKEPECSCMNVIGGPL